MSEVRATAAPRFRFGPRDQRGIFAGVRAGQALVLAVSLLLGLIFLYACPGSTRWLAGASVIAGAAVAFLPIQGRTLDQWLPVAARYSSAGASGAHRDAVQMSSGAHRAPGPFRALHVIEATRASGRSLGVIHDQRRGVLTAAIAARGGSFALRDRGERVVLIDGWASVLEAAARGDAPYRLQWILRTVPDDAAALRERISAASTGSSPGREHERAHAHYRSFVDAEVLSALRYEILLVVATRTGRSGDALGSIASEVGAYERRLTEAGISVDGALTPAGIRQVLSRSFDRAAVFGEVAWPWPVALEERWGAFRTDDAWHATYWIAEWPRHDVDSDFLLPLGLNRTDRRAISVVMSPVPPTRAMRSVERARTSVVADGEFRRRHGFATTARGRHEQQAIVRREAELAEGHAAYRFSGYVTVSAGSPEELDAACSRAEQAGALAKLEMRRLYGTQSEAFCCSLPLARGCG